MIFETRLSPAGKAAGTSTVATGSNGNSGLALVVMPDKTLRLFAPGTGGINTFTAPATGGSWTHQSGLGWGSAIAELRICDRRDADEGRPAGHRLAGQRCRRRSASLHPALGLRARTMTESLLATDAASGAVVLAGADELRAGRRLRSEDPAEPRRRVSPAAPLDLKDWGNGLSGRIGAAGRVYVAYADGKAAHLYRYGGGSKTIATGPYWSATVCAAPAGRLWVAWGDTSGGLFVTRSNRAVSAFEPVQKLKLPGSELTFVQCEGSAGPADLFASGQANGGFFHTHLLAEFALRAQASKGKATVSVRDAGDPVAGVAVAVGGKHLERTPTGSCR